MRRGRKECAHDTITRSVGSTGGTGERGVVDSGGPPPPGLPARPSRRAGSLLELPWDRNIQWRLPWHAGRAGGTPCPSSGTLRKAGNSGVLPGLRRGGAGVRGPGYLRDFPEGGHARLAVQRPRLRLSSGHPPHDSWVGAFGRGYAPSASIAPLVRVRDHSLGGLLDSRGVRGFRGVWPYLVGSGVHALVATGYVDRAALAREVSF